MLRHEPLENGNWVYTQCDGYVRVSGMTKTKIAYHDRNGKFKWIRKESVFAIPITEKILRDNGFIDGELPGVDNEPCWTLTEMDNIHNQRFVRLYWFDGVKNKENGILMIDVKGPYTTIHRAIRSVHELQIAMRFGMMKAEITMQTTV